MITVGTFVKSNFRAGWKGVVVSEKLQSGSGKKAHKISKVLLLKDRCGRTLTRKLTSRLSNSWLEECETFSLTERQIGWIENNRLRYKLRRSV